MAEEDLLIPLESATFTALSDNDELYGTEVVDLGPGVHLVNLIGTFTAMDFGTPPGNASYGLDTSYDGVLWKFDWDWRYELAGGTSDVSLAYSDSHTLPETVRIAGVVTRYVRLRMGLDTTGASFTVESSLVVTGGAAL
jgi:hypothetical protein